MAPRRRGPGKPRIPNLYENGGYYSWRNPRTGKIYGLGRDKSVAFEEAIEANMHLAGALPRVRLLDRLQGKEEHTLEKWLQAYEAILEKRKLSKNTRYNKKTYAKRAREMFDGDQPLRSITPLMIAQALETIEQEDKHTTAQRFRSFLSDCFREAIVKGWIDVSPVEVTKAEGSMVKRSRLTYEVFSRIYDGLGAGWIKNAMALALVSAQRRDDISRFQFRRDIHDDTLWVVQAKTGTKIRLPLALRLNRFGMSLEQVVAQCRATGIASHFLIHQTAGRGSSPLGRHLDKRSITHRFSELIEALEIDWGDKTPPTFHEIRSLAERLYADQGDVNTRELLGHKSSRMTDVYHDARGDEWIQVRIK